LDRGLSQRARPHAGRGRGTQLGGDARESPQRVGPAQRGPQVIECAVGEEAKTICIEIRGWPRDPGAGVM
jgi:hypothetical protein